MRASDAGNHPQPPKPNQLDPLQLMLESSGIVLVVLAILFVAALAVWVIWVLKALQLRRLRGEQRRLRAPGRRQSTALGTLISLALQHRTSPGGRVVLELAKRHHQRHLTMELMLGVAKRAIANEQQRASSLMPTLSSIASASPFIGLFGTVWGIMNAFLRIGVEKSASLPGGRAGHRRGADCDGLRPGGSDPGDDRLQLRRQAHRRSAGGAQRLRAKPGRR